MPKKKKFKTVSECVSAWVAGGHSRKRAVAACINIVTPEKSKKKKKKRKKR